MASPSPRRFQSGGGYRQKPSEDYRSNAYNNHHGSGPPNSPHVHYEHPFEQHPQNKNSHAPNHVTSPNRSNQQQLAQRMVRTDYKEKPPPIKSNRKEDYDAHINSPRYHYNFGNDTVKEDELIPPWDTNATNATRREDYVTRCAESRLRRREDDDLLTEGGAADFYEEDNSFVDQQEQVVSPSQGPTPKSTRSVTFKTRDKIHHWDDQLDQLLHVDEAFFAAAKYLLEDVHNVTDDYLDDQDNDLIHQVQGEKDEQAAGGGILSKLFHCGDVNAVQGEESSENPTPYIGVDGAVLDDGKMPIVHRKKLKLTKKLIQDFATAVKYRMQNLEDEEQVEIAEDVADKIREIARKVETYGLPKLWEQEDIQMEEELKAIETPKKEVFVKPVDSKKSPQRQLDTHFFPLLPENDEDAADNDEEPTAKDQPKTPIRDSEPVTSENNSIFSFLSSICKSKVTPTEEECQRNLQRIITEIQKVQQMSETTHNAAVRSNCVHRIAKLNYEKRFYQIIKEQYKIRQMQKATKSDSVNSACKERMKQLMAELEALDLEKEKLETSLEASGDVEENWYQKAARYVNATNDGQLGKQDDTTTSDRQQQRPQHHYEGNSQDDGAKYVQPPNHHKGNSQDARGDSQYNAANQHINMHHHHKGNFQYNPTNTGYRQQEQQYEHCTTNEEHPEYHPRRHHEKRSQSKGRMRHSPSPRRRSPRHRPQQQYFQEQHQPDGKRHHSPRQYDAHYNSQSQHQHYYKERHEPENVTHHSPHQYEPIHTSHLQHHVHYKTPISTSPPSPPSNIDQNARQAHYNGSKSKMTPKRGQRLPLATPVAKKEGLDKIISFLAP